MTYAVVDLLCLVPRAPASFVQLSYIVVYLLLRSVTYSHKQTLAWEVGLGTLANRIGDKGTLKHQSAGLGFEGGDGFRVPTRFGCGYAVSLVTVLSPGLVSFSVLGFRSTHGAPTPNLTRCHSY
jgi:hypothetical protein